MSKCLRAAGAVGAVCLAIAAFTGGDARADDATLDGMSIDAGETHAIAFPPADRTTKKPIVTMLHGMCDAPENECPWFRDATRDVGWLVCPRANVACPRGGTLWSGKTADRQAPLDASEAALRAKFDAEIQPEGDDVLVGFSNGAFTAVELATASHGRWSSLVLIGASVTPDAKKLEAAGIKRVALAAGDFDGAKNAMVRATKSLGAAGLPAKFFSMGKVGHTFPADMPERMRAAIAWARGGDGA